MPGQEGIDDKSPSSVSPEEAGPRQLVRQVRDALASLYDLSHLQTHPLARLQPRRLTTSPANSAQLLQQRLLDAIEQLRTASEDPAAPERVARRYDLLRLRYIEGLDVRAVCRHLGCSRSDYYRQLEPGLRAVTAYLEADLISGSGPIPLLTSETPLVGREQELELLKAAYSAAASGEGGKVVMISGEQGIGKTRLAQELGKYVEHQGGLFLQGRWAAWEGAPYGATVETLRRGLRQLDPEEVAAVVGPYGQDLARLFPELVQHPAGRPDDTLLSPEEQQLRLYEGVSSIIQNLSRKQPLVMFLDDLHLAQQMRLVLHISRRLEEYRLLIVYAYRDDELIERPVLVAGRNELVRSRLVTDIRLAPLTQAETGRIIAHAFGEAAAAQLQAPIYAINKGNPFFVEEMLRSMVENSAVRWMQDRWEVLDTTRVGIPESVKRLVQERVARLGEEVVAMLQQAALLGQEFSFAALSLMTDQPEDRLVAMLDQAMAAGFLVDRTITATEEQYCFREEHIQDVLYQSIPAARRRRYHLQAGQALNTLYPYRLDELAYHFTHGSDATLGATYSYQAAERASSLFHWGRAIPFYQDALDLWEELGGHVEERAAVAEELGDACYKSGIEAQRAVGYLQQGLRFNEELGNLHKVATLHSQLGREYMHGGNLAVQDMALALEHFHRAKNILDRESEDVPHGMVYCGLAMAHLDHLDLTEAVSWARQAVELGERLDAPAVVANAFAPLGSAMGFSAIGQALEALERGWQASFDNKLGFQADLSRACGARTLGVTLKDPRAGLGWVERGPDYHTTYSLFDIPSHLVALHALKGELEEANRILSELQSRMRGLGQHTFGLWPDELGLYWIRQGEWEQAEAQLSEAFAWAVKSENHMVEAATAEKLGEVYLALHQDSQAEHFLLHALGLIRGSASVVSELALVSHFCQLYLRTGRLGMASQHLMQAQNIAGDSTDWGGLKGDLRLAEGLVFAELGNWGDAERVFQQAVQVYQEHLLPWDEARVCYEWATALMGEGRDGSPGDRARALLTKALSLWEAMGAGRHVELCQRRLG